MMKALRAAVSIVGSDAVAPSGAFVAAGAALPFAATFAAATAGMGDAPMVAPARRARAKASGRAGSLFIGSLTAMGPGHAKGRHAPSIDDDPRVGHALPDDAR